MIGQTVSHYRIIEQLGAGGMGTVYLAEDTVLGRRVAIKTLTDVGPGSQHFRVRFLREARAVSNLSHPHIATIHDYGETPDGQPYIVMEFIKGETLADLMLKESLTIPRALEIISEVAEALGEAHHHGIIHRDIKPSNIAINQRGEVKVLDFGLAKQVNPGFIDSHDPEGQTLLNTQTREGVIVGTPMYLSPEQALGVDVDRRSDLFSLGAVLYECLAGKPPFFGGSAVEICARVIRDDPPPPSQSNDNISKELDRIVLKALAKKQDARYQNADELITDLNEARAEAAGFHQTITRAINVAPGTQPTGAIATLSDIFKRPRLSVGYVVAGIVLVAFLAAVVWKVTRPPVHKPSEQVQALYSRAVDAIREGAFFRASKILQQVVQQDPSFPLAHARLAETWMELDSSDKAKDELIIAQDLVPDSSILPLVDGLRLDAVTHTAKREFGKAVEDYKNLVESVPGDERTYALVDLGRAYEKNEQPDKAIETYQEATRIDFSRAVAFLRLGIMLGRRARYIEAYAAFDQAHKIFDLNSEIEGLTEVLLQRAVVLAQQGKKLNEARTLLLQALEKSLALENKDKQIKVLLNLSNTEILAGNADQARQYSTQALDLARANGLDNLTMHGIIDVGNAYFHTGNFPEAEKSFNEALRLAELYKGERSRARALLSLASLKSQQGDIGSAREYYQRALPFYEQGGYRKEVFQANIVLGRAEAKSGDLTGAQQRFDQLLREAEQSGDRQSLMLAHEGLGRVFLNSQNLPKALEHYKANYEIAKSLNYTSNLGYTSNNLAIVLSQLGHPGARDALQEALAIATPEGKMPLRNLQTEVQLTMASLALIEGKAPEALTLAQKALDLSAEYKSTAIQASYVLALAEARSGNKAQARKRCEEAVNEARQTLDHLLLSNGLLTLAETALVASDYQSAIVNAREAGERFAQQKQLESQWRALAIEAIASEKAGDQPHVRQLAQEASAILISLEQQWGGEHYRSYTERTDIKSLRSQLAALIES